MAPQVGFEPTILRLSPEVLFPRNSPLAQPAWCRTLTVSVWITVLCSADTVLSCAASAVTVTVSDAAPTLQRNVDAVDVGNLHLNVFLAELLVYIPAGIEGIVWLPVPVVVALD